MAESTTNLGPFRGLWSATDGEAPKGFASDVLNVRVGDGTIRPRYGFRNLAAIPTDFVAGYGFSWVEGYDTDYVKQLEWVSIEDRGGTIKPYSSGPSTWARTEITNLGSPLSLEPGKWKGFSFDANSYWINPDSTSSLYRHEVGNIQSWTVLSDATYVPTPEDPTLLVSLDSPVGIPFDATSVSSVAISGSGLSSPTSVITDGELVVSGTAGNNSQSTAPVVTEVLFTTPQDWSGSDYQGIFARGDNADDVYARFKLGVLLEFKIGGSWVAAPNQQPFISSTRAKTGVVTYVKGFTVTAIQGFRLTVRGEPQPHHSGRAFIVSEYFLGGPYLGATISGDRAWSDPYKTLDITYAVRCLDVVAGTASGAKNSVVGASRQGRYVLDNDLAPASSILSRIGDRVSIQVDPFTSGGYSDDPTGLLFQIQYLRLDANGVWHIIGSTPNTTDQTWRDVLDERALELLSAASPAVTGYAPPTPAPVFATGQLVSGFPFKGGVVWLYKQGKTNIRYSRVGDAESLANPDDDVNDTARGADFTMADDFADEPLGGCQAGDAVLILGKEGLYGQAGNAPYLMTPPRKLPGSLGGGGRFSFARFRDESGNPGIAWYDFSGENVWFAAAGLVYSVDTQARPVELSSPIRGTLRRFLLDEQKEALPDILLEDACMDVDEATGSLWLFLGKRAAVLRPPSLIDGQRQWELYDYALGSMDEGLGESPVNAMSDPFGPTSGSDVARGGSTLAWTSPTSVVVGTGVASAGAFQPGLSSHWLKGTAFVPVSLLPAEATITQLSLRARHRRTSLGSVPTPVFVSSVKGFNGGVLGSTVAGSELTSSAFVDTDIVLSGLSATVAELNAGAIDAEIAYDALVVDPTDYDPGNWVVQYIPSGGTKVDGGTATPWAGAGPWGSGISVPLSESHQVVSEGTVLIRATWQMALIDCPPYMGLTVTTSLSSQVDSTFLAQGSTAAMATHSYTIPVDVSTGIGELTVSMMAKGAYEGVSGGPV